MSATIEITNYVLSLLGIATFLAGGILIIDLYSSRALAKLIEVWGLLFAFIVATGASLFTLVYSEVFGFIPCGLCWLQRITLFPQVIVLGVELFYKDKTAPRYGIALSTIGLIVSLYHHYIQMGGSEFIKCPAVGAGVSCSQRFFFEFGFITFPLMSSATFLFLIALYFYLLKTARS